MRYQGIRRVIEQRDTARQTQVLHSRLRSLFSRLMPYAGRDYPVKCSLVSVHCSERGAVRKVFEEREWTRQRQVKQEQRLQQVGFSLCLQLEPGSKQSSAATPVACAK